MIILDHEFLDKFSDNTIMTTASGSAGIGATLGALPEWLTVGILVAVLLLIRVGLEHAYRRRERRRQHEIARRHFMRRLHCPPKSRRALGVRP
jgi:hypothetical protein